MAALGQCVDDDEEIQNIRNYLFCFQFRLGNFRISPDLYLEPIVVVDEEKEEKKRKKKLYRQRHIHPSVPLRQPNKNLPMKIKSNYQKRQFYGYNKGWFY